jgi:hypothetical protein
MGADRKQTVNRQQEEAQNEPKAKSAHTVLIPGESAKTEELADSPPATAPEIEHVFQQIKTESVGGLAYFLRYLFAYEERRPIDPTAVMKMKVDDMLAVLVQESRKRAGWKKFSIGTGLSLIALIFAFSIYTRDISLHALFALCAPLGLLFTRGAASRKQQAIAMAITQFDDVRAVGPLAEALEFPHEAVVPVAEKALIRLLPRLKASDVSLLNSAQRACLNLALRGGNTELTLAILKAWEQVGDADAISAVQQLAEGRTPDRRAEEKSFVEVQERDNRELVVKTAKRLSVFLVGARRPEILEADRPKIVAAAQECLPALRQSVENRQIGSQLLRPADGNLTPSDVLLRPTIPHVSTEPSGELLRPTNVSV